jgi:hypothetical protein
MPYKISSEKRAYNKLYHNNRNNNTRIDILTHYGNGILACVACGENQLPCLSIDHIKGKGTQHRHQTGIPKGGVNFYRWLQKQGYPEGYQTLCMNCQYIKRDLAKEYGNIPKEDN